jgi:hypothetical protein
MRGVRVLTFEENVLITKHVSFSNTELDNFGMPTNYRAYFIMARKAESGESAHQSDGIAKIYTLSTQAVALNPDHVVADGGPENAVSLAIEKLKSLNSGLNIRVYENEQP